jgi:hypothetical protein
MWQLWFSEDIFGPTTNVPSVPPRVTEVRFVRVANGVDLHPRSDFCWSCVGRRLRVVLNGFWFWHAVRLAWLLRTLTCPEMLTSRTVAAGLEPEARVTA